jgi:hypothetical protein
VGKNTGVRHPVIVDDPFAYPDVPVGVEFGVKKKAD